MNPLSNEERETHLNMVADDRTIWVCYTDDPVMAARLDKIAEGVVKGWGKEYTLRADQVVLRKGKRAVTEAQRENLRKALANRQRIIATESADPKPDIVE